MNNLRNYLGLSALTMGLCLMSCNDDNTPSYSQTTMKNSELKTILQQKGYQFNEQGNLLLDDLANNTTTLDLSGTKLFNLSELAFELFFRNAIWIIFIKFCTLINAS